MCACNGSMKTRERNSEKIKDFTLDALYEVVERLVFEKIHFLKVPTSL